MFRPQHFLLATALLSALSAAAQSPDTTQTIKNQQLQPVEVRSLRASSNAPFAKTEIAGKQLQQNNLGTDLPFLLQFTPSAVVTSDAGAGVGYTGLRIRGTDGTRINVTLNGIPVNDAESQGAFFVDLPDLASSASSIQIQRGVGTSTNGAGSFGGSISISNLEQMKNAGAEGSFSIGSFNTQKYTVRAGTGLLQNGWQFDVRLSKISSDGYIQRSASDLRSLQLLAKWNVSESSTLRFMLLTGKEKTGQAWNGVPQDSLQINRTYNELGLKSDGTYYNDQSDNYKQDYYQLFFDHKFSKHLTGNIAAFLTRGKGYYQEYKTGASFSDYGLPAFISGIDTLTNTDLIRQLWLDNYYYGSVFSLLYEKNKTQVSFGGGYTRYDGRHYGFVKWAEYNVPNDYQWYLLDAHKQDLNVYLKGQQQFANLILFADLQWRNVHHDINGFRDNPALTPSVTYNFFNPKIGLTYLLKESNLEKQKVYASFAVANKEPNRDDFEAAINALPKAERLYDVEAGYDIHKIKWSAGVNFYYMDYKDQLVVTGKINDVGAYTRTNVPQSHRAGVELMAGAKPFSWLAINANATVSENKIKGFTEYIDKSDDTLSYPQETKSYGSTDIAFSPNVTGAVGITISPFRRLSHGQTVSFEILNKYVGKQYLDNTSNDNRAIDPYDLTDVRIHYSLNLKPFKEVSATLALNNVFNKMYSSNGYTFSYIYDNTLTTQNYYFPQAGFNWLLGLNLKW